jgi:glycosyltransferase involved in cell wall biosynthesis
MKVVHVSTIDSGGAANAAYRLHDALLKSGVQSKFLVLHHEDPSKNVVTFETSPADFLFFLLRKLKLNRFNIRFRKALRSLGNKIEIFSAPQTIYDISEHAMVREADIIHLHWIANFVDYSIFFKLKNKTIVWTFHDENPLHGGIHYADDLKELSPELKKWESVFRESKRTALLKAENIWPICPSPWLLQQVRNAPFKAIFNRAVCIYYGIDVERFALQDRQSARQQLGLTSAKRLILVICSNLDVHRKGFDLFSEMNQKIKKQDEVEFILVGDIKQLPALNFVNYLGPVKDQAKLVQLYNAADATLIPSREDNLPNVMIESLACGTPVLGFRIGGIQDVVKEDSNGLLAMDISAQALYELTIKFLSAKAFDRHRIRMYAVANFDNKVQVQKVTSIYHQSIHSIK